MNAINLTLGDTIRLRPTVREVNGEIVADPIGIRFTSSTPSRVSIDSAGLIRAEALTESPVAIVTAISKDFVTVTDTTLVYVRSQAIAAQRFVFSIEDDSTGFGVGYTPDYEAYIITPANDTIDDIIVRLTSSNSNILFINRINNSSYINTRSLGTARLYASTTVGRQTFTDSLDLTIGYAAEGQFGWNGRWYWPEVLQVVIQPGGTVWFFNWGGPTSGPITFNNPAAALASPWDANGGSGNIPAFMGTRHGRRFVTPGTYTWTGNGQTGTIIVRANPGS